MGHGKSPKNEGLELGHPWKSTMDKAFLCFFSLGESCITDGFSMIFNDFQSPCLQEGKQQQHIFSCHLNTQKTSPKDLSSERLSAVV